MSPGPSFSVVIPLYNKAAHIEATLRSTAGQSHPPDEIIVVDDGSTDNSAEIVRSLDLPRVRLIQQANGGVARARNTGIAAAQGDWIVFLDADDWQHTQFIHTLGELIRQHPAVDMVATQYRSVSAGTTSQTQDWPVDIARAGTELITDLPARWMKGASIFTSSIAVRSSRLRSLDPWFPPGEHYGEDLDLWFRLAEVTPIALHNAPLVARVWVPDGLSVRHAARTEAPFLLRMEERALSGKLPNALANSALRFVNQIRISLARDAISAGQRQVALALLWRARRAAGTHRWWSTAGMTVLLPGMAVSRWQRWRKRRKMIVG